MYKYKYCLLRIWGNTLEINNDNIKVLKEKNEDQNVIDMISKWNFKNNYYLSGSIQIIYTNIIRNKQQIEKDYYQQLFDNAYNNYDYFNFKIGEDDDYIDDGMNSDDESSYLYYKSKYNDIFKVEVSNNNDIDQNKNFELTITVPTNFNSIAFHIPNFLQNLIIKDHNGNIIKEIHNNKKLFDSYIEGFNIKS